MKKLFFNVLILFGITITAAAQAYNPIPMAVTPATQIENNVLYFASQNDYSAEMYKSYFVWDKTSVSWVKRVELIAPVPVTNPYPLYKIIYKGDDVCQNDACLIKPATKPGGQ